MTQSNISQKGIQSHDPITAVTDLQGSRPFAHESNNEEHPQLSQTTSEYTAALVLMLVLQTNW